MKEINVAVKTEPVSYTLKIGHDLPALLAAELAEKKPASRYVIITDSTVGPLWADAFSKALKAQGLPVDVISFPAGEANKTRATKEALEDQMISHGLGRDCLVLALGGGVVGDVAGFAAATYMRGVPVIQIPTTTLSMADSSIGGKTGVDTPAGKNLIGAFHHPLAVYMDVSTLKTQDDRNYFSGLAEVIKHGFIRDPEIISFLEAHREELAARKTEALEELFQLNCHVKNEVVSQDQTEKGLRQILNYGHTMGHAVEMLSGFNLQHGECVSIGMVFAGRLAVFKGMIPDAVAQAQEALLKAYGLPTEIPEGLAADDLIRVMHSDKKVREGKLRFVLPTGPNEVIPGVEVTEEEVRCVLLGPHLDGASPKNMVI